MPIPIIVEAGCGSLLRSICALSGSNLSIEWDSEYILCDEHSIVGSGQTDAGKDHRRNNGSSFDENVIDE